jgi:glycosyltransferase involved in cell wall biosynthesis
MKPRGVLLMTRTLGHGGTERQLTEIALSLNRDLFTPHVGCVEGQGFRADEMRTNGVSILELPMTSMLSRQSFSGVLRLWRYIRRHRIALVHAFDTAMNIFAVPVTKALFGPVVLSSQRCHENTIWPQYRKPARFAHYLADGVVVNCEAMKQHLMADYSIPERKIHLCYNGLDTSVFYPAPAVRPDWLRDACHVIGSVCVLRPEKGLATLIEAFALVRKLHPGLRLVIVGSGPELGALEHLARDLGIARECFFSPSTNDVAGWLRTMDVFVLPSLSEAFSNSIMEAMGCGCCTIASRVGGNPELIEDGVTGMLFETGSAPSLTEKLRLAIENPELRNTLARNGEASVASRFSIQTSARRMEEIYTQLLR